MTFNFFCRGYALVSKIQISGCHLNCCSITICAFFPSPEHFPRAETETADGWSGAESVSLHVRRPQPMMSEGQQPVRYVRQIDIPLQHLEGLRYRWPQSNHHMSRNNPRHHKPLHEPSRILLPLPRPSGSRSALLAFTSVHAQSVTNSLLATTSCAILPLIISSTTTPTVSCPESIYSGAKYTCVPMTRVIRWDCPSLVCLANSKSSTLALISEQDVSVVDQHRYNNRETPSWRLSSESGSAEDLPLASNRDKSPHNQRHQI